MFDFVIVPLILQFLAPLGLLAWLAYGRHGSRAALLLRAILVAAYVETVAVAGLWLVLPSFLPAIYVVLFVLALVHAWRLVPIGTGWPAASRGWIGIGVRGALAAAAMTLTVYALSGLRPPREPAADLTFPLRGMDYSVVNGGSTGLVNAHHMTLTGERFRPYRGQSYGVDLVRFNRWGLRARGFLPGVPSAYVIFGDSVFAPCSGTVIEAVDGLADMSPPTMDRKHMAGNHVLLASGKAWVLVGHLRAGSVRVRTGDLVRAGELLGAVGNSGNSGEPHLHIHAQRPGTKATPFSGDPIPITFDGRYLVRNARISRT
jgi:hypothetical protein